MISKMMPEKLAKKLGSGLALQHFTRYHAQMACPLRIEFPGGPFQVTARGDRREAIFLPTRRHGRFCTARRRPNHPDRQRCRNYRRRWHQ